MAISPIGLADCCRWVQLPKCVHSNITGVFIYCIKSKIIIDNINCDTQTNVRIGSKFYFSAFIAIRVYCRPDFESATFYYYRFIIMCNKT
ncbi:MAG: hypothetical protein DRJ61_18580 [Acidobacteria bacterium]|nr:MAG: hypothetical protein DRJ61_18580 [Acidobacteriota bacterium]